MKSIEDYGPSTWIYTLPETVQDGIRALLQGMGLDEEDVEAGRTAGSVIWRTPSAKPNKPEAPLLR